MPVRVRKLARDLDRTPGQVLGLLHALGFPRYKSSEDQLADPVAAKVRAAVRVGMTADPVEPEAERQTRPEAPIGQAQRGGMALLVPGVVPLGQKAPATPAVAATPARAASVVPPTAASVGTAAPNRPATPDRVAALVAERDALLAERGARMAERDALIAERDASRAERDALIAARDAQLATQRTVVEASAREARPGPAATSLAGLLELRGLRGRDEHARAIAALLRDRWVEVDALAVTDVELVRRALTDRVVLVDGDVPEPLTGVVGVSVSPDRAEVPGAREIGRRLDRIGELLLLNGWRRLRAVGVPVRWHGVLRSKLDPRVELSIVPGGPRGADAAARDVDGVEVVWLWAVPGDAAAREVWATARLLIDGPERLGEALDAARSALERG